MENTDKSKGYGKLLEIRQLLLTLHTKFQPYCQAVKRTERQERVEVGRRTPKSI